MVSNKPPGEERQMKASMVLKRIGSIPRLTLMFQTALMGLMRAWASSYLIGSPRFLKSCLFSANDPAMAMGGNRFKKASIMALVLIILTGGESVADDSTKVISIAIFPCTDEVMSFKKFNPLFIYIEKGTGLTIEMVVPVDLEEFRRKIQSGAISFALQDPHIYTMLFDQYDHASLLATLNRDGKDTQTGVIIVRKDSGLLQLKDLLGKSVMFGPKLSTTKWLATKQLFEENGFNLDRDLRSYSNGKCCEDIAFSVFLKSIEAGVICDHFLEEHSLKQQELGVDASELVVIARTKPVLTRVFAACRGVSRAVIQKINNALLHLDNQNDYHKKVLFPTELGGFKKADHSTYEGLKRVSVIGSENISPQKKEISIGMDRP